MTGGLYRRMRDYRRRRALSALYAALLVVAALATGAVWGAMALKTVLVYGGWL